MIKCTGSFRSVRAVVLALALSASGALAQTSPDLFFEVTVRGSGSAVIHAHVFDNPNALKGDTTVLAVHGGLNRGSMFRPLADAMFADRVLGNKIERIVSMDAIFHGLSSPPSPPIKFGDLLSQDYVDVLIQTVDYLNTIDMTPQMIMGHSVGGLVVQGAQENLLTQGSSLRALGVKRVALIAAVPARGTTWTNDSSLALDLTPFIVTDPVLGTYVYVPPAFHLGLGGYSTLSGTLVPNAPSPATLIANDWAGPEPINGVLEVLGVLCSDPNGANGVGLCRPYARPGAFAARNGTTLTVLGFSQDLLTPFVDQAPLYKYLTGKSSEGPDSLFVPIVANDAVHQMFITNPSVVAQALRKVVR